MNLTHEGKAQTYTINRNCKSEEKSLETCATTIAKIKVAKLRANPKTLGTADIKCLSAYYAMMSVAFE